MTLNDIVRAIEFSKTIGISFHVSPDGDSLGSAVALALALEKMHKDVYIICKDNIPDIYKFLPFSKVNIVESIISKITDCVIVLDCGDVKRICADVDILNKDYTLINIDHHLSNQFYGDINLVDTNSSAVGEIVYELIRAINIPLDSDIAKCIYTSIVSDTGGFKYSNTTSKTHNITADLVSYNINFNDIHMTLFQSKKLSRVKLYGKIIEEMYLLESDKLCIMKLSKNMLNDLNIEASDTSDIISIGTDVDSVEVAVLLKESDNGVKISLRSKKIVDVRKIAERFGGGGHTRASGLTIDKSLEESENIIINAIKEELI
jgi:phosphoesterase RecJ-like protein